VKAGDSNARSPDSAGAGSSAQPSAPLPDELARELNEQQLAAVTAPEKQVLVLAGAGSGKTRVITYRVAYLLHTGVKPGNILLATFTNKAARMMLKRVETLTGIPAYRITGGTFHHIGHLLLRRYAKAIGYRRDFTILDEADARQLMKVVRKGAGIDFKKELFPSASQLYSLGSLAFNTTRSIEELVIFHYPHFAPMVEGIKSVLDEYTQRKRKQNLLDFDDLLGDFLRLFDEAPQIGEEIAGRFRHVLVDEYQDTNSIQVELVKRLASVHGNVFVVGDDAQSIYGFRGARYKNILDFPQDYPDARIYKLEVNYRSTPDILSFANEIMKGAPEEFRKRLTTSRPPLHPPKVIVCRDLDEQAQFVAEQVLALREEGVPLDEMAVLYRNHRNSLELEVELNSHGIPYSIRGGIRFMEQAHIKDLVAFPGVIANPHDQIAFSRILELCEHVGSITVGRIFARIMPAEDPLFAFTKDGVVSEARGAGRKSLEQLATLLSWLRKLREEGAPVSELLRATHEDFYRQRLESTFDDYREREEDIEQLIIFADRFKSLTGFLSEIALSSAFTPREALRTPEAFVEEGCVSLSTIHQAKGLEWRAVFITHLSEGNLPHRMSWDDAEELEEERRLFYVAVTRARDILFLSYGQNVPGQDYIGFNRPTRYLREIPSSLYEQYVIEVESEAGEGFGDGDD